MSSTATAPERAKRRTGIYCGGWEIVPSVRRWRVACERQHETGATAANRCHIAKLWAAIPVEVRRCMAENMPSQLDRRDWPSASFYWQLLGEAGELARAAERNLPPSHPIRKLMQPVNDRADNAPLPTLGELVDMLGRFHDFPDAAKRKAMAGWQPYNHAPFRAADEDFGLVELEHFGAYEQTQQHMLQLSGGGGSDWGRVSITHTLVLDDSIDSVHVLIAAGTSKSIALATLDEIKALMEEHWDTLTDYRRIVGAGSVPETKRSGSPETQPFATCESESEEEALMPTAA